ncbi:MAG TPA: hypothetical protein VLX85_09695 [Stellaceae bacterium]|nr:hypothetical protein [Stellaceae bacterium]
MTPWLSRRVALTIFLAAAASALGTAITRADPPGYLFMDINDGQALVVQQAHDGMAARILKQPATLPDDMADRITAEAQPVGDHVIVEYKGQLYILPDKKVGKHMATHMVMNAAGTPNQ